MLADLHRGKPGPSGRVGAPGRVQVERMGGHGTSRSQRVLSLMTTSLQPPGRNKVYIVKLDRNSYRAVDQCTEPLYCLL